VRSHPINFRSTRSWFLRLALAAIGMMPLLASGSASSPKQTVVFFGDSLTAGYGLDDPDTEAFPALIRRRIEALDLPWRVVAAGLSGETTAGGLRRIDWVLREPADVIVVELGANDGLRGVPIATTRSNLQGIVDRIRRRLPHATILLVGMKMPASLGEDYRRDFGEVFPAIARANNLPLVPFLLAGVAGHPDLNQADSIHPTAQGHALVAQTVWSALAPLLGVSPAERVSP
jgi:acyl-CoA thioesterase-1